MGSSSDQKCAVCGRSFSMMLWKHTCDVCRRTVCDDCAPRSTESIDASGAATKLRVCKSCGTTGRRLGGGGGDTTGSAGDKSNSYSTGGQPPSVQPGGVSGPAAGGQRMDPNSEAERERRAAIIEARNKSQQSRGRPQGGSAGAAPRATTTPTPQPASSADVKRDGPSAAATPPVATSPVTATSAAPAASTTTAAGTATSTGAPASANNNSNNNSNASRPTNPALEAALRRQQQQQARNAANAPAINASPEKLRLLREIDALLAKHHEEPPFGLRASDESKLKSFLQYLKSKYNVSE